MIFRCLLYPRFDLIFLMLDPQDEFYDRRLATHLVSLYHQTQEEEEEEYLVSMINQQLAIFAVKHCHK